MWDSKIAGGPVYRLSGSGRSLALAGPAQSVSTGARNKNNVEHLFYIVVLTLDCAP